MELTIDEAKQRIEALRKLEEDLGILHLQLMDLYAKMQVPRTVVDDPNIDAAVTYLREYEFILENAVKNVKIVF